MKKQMTIAFAALIIFALAIVALAYTKATETTPTAAISCPMQEKHHGAQNAAADTDKNSCGMADCCKDGKCSMGGACCKSGDSCPMKNNKENKENSAATDAYSRITFADDAAKADCCKTGASCCAGGAGACCKGKHG